jgi:ABC-type sugar transport system substrate-binding protein
MIKSRRNRWLTTTVVLVAGLALAAGCSTAAGPSMKESAGGGDGTSAPVGSSSAAITAAKAEFVKYLKPQPAIVVPELPSKPPTGLSVTITGCPLPVCVSLTSPAVEAAKTLGWKVAFLQVGLTPQAYQASLNQVLQSPPRLAAITSVTPDSFVSRELAAIARTGTEIAEIAPAGDNPSTGGPVKAAVNGAPEMAESGRLMGDAVVADGGKASSVFVWDSSFSSIWGPVKRNFTDVVAGAGGTVDVLDVSQANIGKSIPTQVTSYLQAHPNVRYVAFALSDLDAGVPQALRAAGLSSRVKLISRGPSITTLKDIADGDEWATVGEEDPSNGYRVIDQLARLVMNVPLSGDLRNPAGWHQIFIRSNVPGTSSVPTPPGYPEAFLAAWHLR